MDKKTWETEIDTASGKLVSYVGRIDVNEDNSGEKLEDVSKLLKEIAADRRALSEAEDNEVKNALESERNAIEHERIEVDKRRNEIEAERNAAQAELEAERNNIEAKRNSVEVERNVLMAKESKWKIIISALAAILPAILWFVLDLFKERKRHDRFLVANKIEDTEPYLKRSSIKAVDDGLSDHSQKIR